MEVDAFLILVLSVVRRPVGRRRGCSRSARPATRSSSAGWLLPWLREPMPPRYWCKVVAAIQGIVLTVAVADVLPALAVEHAARDRRSPCSPSRSGTRCGGSRGTGTRSRAAPRRDPADRDACARQPDPDAPPTARRGRQRVAPRLGVGRPPPSRSCSSGSRSSRPNRLDQLTLRAFLRIPVEASRRRRPRPRAAAALATGPGDRRSACVLGLLAIVKILDMGFYAELDRPFNPVTDWSYFGPAIGVLRDSVGPDWANARRRRRRAARGRAARPRAALGAAPDPADRAAPAGLGARGRARSASSGSCAPRSGVHIVAGAPVASTSAAALAYDQVDEVRAGDPGPSRRSRPSSSRTDPVQLAPRRATCSPGCAARTSSSPSSRATAESRSRARRSRPQVDAVLNAGTADAAGRRLLLAQRVPRLADVRRDQLAGALDAAVRPVDQHASALRPARRRATASR